MLLFADHPRSDFAEISDIRQRSVLEFPDYEIWRERDAMFICEGGTGAQQFWRLVIAHCRNVRALGRVSYID